MTGRSIVLSHTVCVRLMAGEWTTKTSEGPDLLTPNNNWEHRTSEAEGAVQKQISAPGEGTRD